MDELRSKLFYEQKNGYDRIDTAERIETEKYCRAYMTYLNDSRTEREAVDNAVELAERCGFVKYVPGMALKAGDKVYANNRGKALTLAVIGRKPLSEGAVIAGAHIDSPRLDLKQVSLVENDELAYFKTTAASRSISGLPPRWSCTASWRSRAGKWSRSPSAVSRTSPSSS